MTAPDHSVDTMRPPPATGPALAAARSAGKTEAGKTAPGGEWGHGLTFPEIRGIITGIGLAMFLAALEQTIVAPALPTIGRSLGDAESLSWIVTAYLLAATAVTPLFGKLSDIYGRRALMLLCISVFTIGSVACAVAPNMPTLIAARALQGIGGGGILPLSQTIIADLLSPRDRPRYQAYSAIIFVGSSILGPILGGFLTDYAHWSLIFWINVPIGAVALYMSDRALRRLPRNDRPHRLDVLGALLMVGAAMTLMLSLTWGGSRYPWLSLPIVTLIAGSVALWLLFAVRLATAREPFIPLTMLRDGTVRAIVASGFFSIGTIVGLSIFLPVYFELVLGVSPSFAGTALIAFMAGTVAGSMISGRLLVRMKAYRRVPVAGLTLAAAAVAGMAIDPAGLSLAAVAPLLFLCGLGSGMMYAVSTVLIQNAVPLYQVGTATGALNFFRHLGSAIIVAVFGAIVLGAADSGALPGAAVDIGHGAARLAHGAGSVAAFANVYRIVFVAAAMFFLAAAVAISLIEERPLRGAAEKKPAAEQKPAADVGAGGQDDVVIREAAE